MSAAHGRCGHAAEARLRIPSAKWIKSRVKTKGAGNNKVTGFGKASRSRYWIQTGRGPASPGGGGAPASWTRPGAGWGAVVPDARAWPWRRPMRRTRARFWLCWTPFLKTALLWGLIPHTVRGRSWSASQPGRADPHPRPPGRASEPSRDPRDGWDGWHPPHAPPCAHPLAAPTFACRPLFASARLSARPA
jgi:hypothetical protein